jgi:hypothetical protein
MASGIKPMRELTEQLGMERPKDTKDILRTYSCLCRHPFCESLRFALALTGHSRRGPHHT